MCVKWPLGFKTPFLDFNFGLKIGLKNEEEYFLKWRPLRFAGIMMAH
jgi:hypothetical protein